MGFVDQIVPVSPAGAGRSLDLTWPDYLGPMPANGSAIPIGRVSLGRQGMNTPTVSNTQSQSLTGVASAVSAATGTGFNGRGGVQLLPGTGANGTGPQIQLGPMTIMPNFGAAAVNTDQSLTDDFACWRCFVIAAFGLNNSFGFDVGPQWTAANVGANGIIAGAAGFGFCQTAAGDVSFIRRAVAGVAPVTSTVILSTTANSLVLWRTYEIRIVGATPTNNAQLKVLINGNRVLTLDWVNDGIGSPLASTGVFGYITTLSALCANAGGPGGMVVQRVRFMAGPTESSLL